MRVVCYKAKRTPAKVWVKLEVYIRIKKRGDVEAEYQTRDDLLADWATKRYLSEKSFQRMLAHPEYYHCYLLKKPFKFSKSRTLWLRPDGMIMLARLVQPKTDPRAFEVEPMFGPFGHSYRIDVQEARRLMKNIGSEKMDLPILQRTLSDLQAICCVLPFFQEYGIDVEKLFSQTEEAMDCLTCREKEALRHFQGLPGQRVNTLDYVAAQMHVTRERARQMIITIAKKIRARIRYNGLRKKAGLEPDRTAADYS